MRLTKILSEDRVSISESNDYLKKIISFINYRISLSTYRILKKILLIRL